MANISSLLGAEAETLLGTFTPKIDKSMLILPGANFLEESFGQSDRSEAVI